VTTTTDAADFPSLAGIERWRAEDWNWACATFGWAVFKLRRIEADAAARPLNERLWQAADDTREAITEQLADWEPVEPPN
jgi:hypothetical protein